MSDFDLSKNFEIARDKGPLRAAVIEGRIRLYTTGDDIFGTVEFSVLDLHTFLWMLFHIDVEGESEAWARSSVAVETAGGACSPKLLFGPFLAERMREVPDAFLVKRTDRI